MYKNFCILVLSIFSFCTIAESQPLVLEINKSTYEEVVKKYTRIDKGINAYSSGKMYEINYTNIDMEGLKELLTIFDQNDKLIGIIMLLNKDKYNSLFNNLSSKYNIVSNQAPFVGNKIANKASC